MQLLSNLVGKKWTLAVLGIIAITLMVVARIDLETMKWAAGSIATLIGLTNLGQGIADGMSNGETSAH